MRNADSERQAVVALLLLDGRADPCIDHHSDRAVECVQKKTHILEQAHNALSALRLNDRLRIFLRLEKFVDIFLGTADIQLMLDDIIGDVDAVGLIVQAQQRPGMPLGQIVAADQLHILLRQPQQPSACSQRPTGSSLPCARPPPVSDRTAR